MHPCIQTGPRGFVPKPHQPYFAFDVVHHLLGHGDLIYWEEIKGHPLKAQEILKATGAANITHVRAELISPMTKKLRIRTSYFHLWEVLSFEDWNAATMTEPLKFEINSVSYLDYRDAFFSVFRTYDPRHYWKIAIQKTLLGRKRPEWLNIIWWGRYGHPISGIPNILIQVYNVETCETAQEDPYIYEDWLMVALVQRGESWKLWWDFCVEGSGVE